MAFGLGLTAGAISSLYNLGVGAPTRTIFQPYSAQITLGDGTVRGVGFPKATWYFNALSLAQRDILRTFCSGASAEIYVETKTVDSSDTYDIYYAVMQWPLIEERGLAGIRRDLTIEFTRMVAV